MYDWDTNEWRTGGPLQFHFEYVDPMDADNGQPIASYRRHMVSSSLSATRRAIVVPDDPTILLRIFI